MNGLKEFLYQRVYGMDHPGLIELRKAGEMLKELFRYWMAHTDELPTAAPEEITTVEARAATVRDFVAGMTDRYAERAYARIGRTPGREVRSRA